METNEVTNNSWPWEIVKEDNTNSPRSPALVGGQWMNDKYKFCVFCSYKNTPECNIMNCRPLANLYVHERNKEENND